MVVRTASDAASGAGGTLAAAEAEVTRLRFGLEGSRPFRLGGGLVLTPDMEIAVRRHGGLCPHKWWPVAFWQVSPGGAGAEHPHDAVEHAPIIHTGDAARLVRQQRFDHAPFEVGQVVAVHRWAPTLWELES